jgi:tetratricopeptide (TPR) repeat protein
MDRPAFDVAASLRKAAELMDRRGFAEARHILAPIVAAQPALADARYLLGASLRALGEAAAAEDELRAVLHLDPNRDDAAVELARLLALQGRFEELLDATAAPAAAARPREVLLVERARALRALDRMDECAALRERIVALYPGKIHSLHNLAAAAGDAGLAEQAEAAARSALALGGDAPETWLVLARALQSQNRFDAAQAAFREAARRRPGFTDALRDLAQLVWMRTGEVEAAVAAVDAASGVSPAAGPVRALKARLHEYAGDARRGYELLTGQPLAGDASLEIIASHLALGFDPARALDHALRAAALSPESDAVQRKLIDVHLAVGQPHAALEKVEARLAVSPLDQGLIAAQWLAWRLLDDRRASALYDYEALVAGWTIDVPPGWSRLEDYLTDLAAALSDLHQLRTHPMDQSLRHGTQTSANLLRSAHPAIRAFSTAIDGPIRRHMAFLGSGPGRVRSRNTGNYSLKGMWSVRLSSGGFHVDHVHPMGWLSSACYVALPGAVDAGGREGWLKFGEPGTPTSPALAPEHFVRPQPGLLVLFPSYMWHGTVPFADDDPRLTIAFDVVPT